MWYVLTLPIVFVLVMTVPDVRREGYHELNGCGGMRMSECKRIAKRGVRNRNKNKGGLYKHLSAFVHVCSRLLAFACVFASAFACVCPRLSAFVCVCSLLLTPPFVAPPSGPLRGAESGSVLSSSSSRGPAQSPAETPQIPRRDPCGGP